MSFPPKCQSLFLLAFIRVFLPVIIGSTAVTFFLPEKYGSTARIQSRSDDPWNQEASIPYTYDDPFFYRAIVANIRSDDVLIYAVKKLDLNVRWGRKYYGGT